MGFYIFEILAGGGHPAAGLLVLGREIRDSYSASVGSSSGRHSDSVYFLYHPWGMYAYRTKDIRLSSCFGSAGAGDEDYGFPEKEA